MSKNVTEAVVEEVQEVNGAEGAAAEKGNPLVEATHKVLLASVGAVALAQDEAEDFVNKLIERGQIADKDGRKMLREMMERRKPQVEAVETVEVPVEEIAEAEEPAEAELNLLLKVPFSVLWLGLGAAALTLEGVEHFANKLVERGEVAEQDARKFVDDLKERRKKRTEAVTEELDKHLEETLTRLNIPTKTDIDALSAKIADLAKKVEALKTS